MFDVMSRRALEALEASELTNPETILTEVLRALREPSDEMIEVMMRRQYTSAEIAKAVWQGAIDHLLNPFV